MLIKPWVTSIFIWKYTEALFRGLFSGVMVRPFTAGSPVGHERHFENYSWEKGSACENVKVGVAEPSSSICCFVEECLCDTKAAICRYWGHRSFMYCEQHPKSGSWCLYSSFLPLRREDLKWGFPWPANIVLAGFQCIRQLREPIIKPACHRFWSILS